VANLPLVTGFVEGCAQRFGLEANQMFGLLIAVKEAFANICRDGEGEAKLACCADGDALVLEIADQGIPFDLLSLPEPDTTFWM
jgi:anti-sigma regulatory factor (Ser/Thr protein kinase)